MSFAYTPSTGLLDTSAYPTVPGSETAARQQFMDLFNQARDYMNNSLIAKNPLFSWTAPTLLNSWTSYTPSPAGYLKDDMGFVRLRGAAQSGTMTAGTKLFTLPVGYRPNVNRNFNVVLYTSGSASTTIIISVLSNGDVTITNAISGNFALFLDGIIFQGEQ